MKQDFSASHLRLGECVIDLQQGVVFRGGLQETMTPREAELLRYLVAHPHTDLDRHRIQSELWGYHPTSRSRALDTVVKRLRARLESNGAPSVVLTVRGLGYRFEPPPPVPASAQSVWLTPTAPFFGRADALALARQHLNGGARLVTITGPAGVGKTRFAIELLRTLTVLPADGLYVCDCTPARTVSDVVTELAHRLSIDLPSARGADRRAAFIDRLRQRGPVLILLDNLEQVEPDIHLMLGAWLRAAPGVRLLVTSRHVLQLPEERIIRLSGLAARAARTLFLDRALARVGEVVAPDDDPDLIALIEDLDRLPLALELAAAQMVALDPATLRAQLTHRRLQLGAAPLHEAETPRRHASLAVALSWGWDLLVPWQRVALMQLAVMPNGFSLLAAERLLDLRAFSDAPFRLQVVLHQLVSFSWLGVHRSPRLRYQFLACVRQFILERADAGVITEASLRLAGWAAGFGTPDALRQMRGPAAAERLQELSEERSNLLAGAHAARQQGATQTAVNATLAAATALQSIGALEPARELIDRSQETLDLEPALRFRLHRKRIEMQMYIRPPDSALLNAGRALAAALPPPAAAWLEVDAIEWDLFFERRPDPAALDDLDRRFQDAGDALGAARTAVQRFRLHCRFEAAPVDERFHQTLLQVRAVDDLLYEADLHVWFGVRLAMERRQADAREVFRRCRAYQAALGGFNLTMAAQVGAIYEAWGQGELETAAARSAAAHSYAQTHGAVVMMAFIQVLQATLFEAMGRYREALEVAHPIAHLFGTSLLGQRARFIIALVLSQQGESDAARVHCTQLSETILESADGCYLRATLAFQDAQLETARDLAVRAAQAERSDIDPERRAAQARRFHEALRDKEGVVPHHTVSEPR
ncbi:MAG: winged helix-turn-helix domain-containing protein [Myxococcota bacterium]